MKSSNNNTMLRSAEGIGTMEREPISKNRVSPKNDRSRRNLLVLAILSYVALIILGLSSCVTSQSATYDTSPVAETKTVPIAQTPKTPISPFSIATSPIVEGDGGYYAISYKDNNLYFRKSGEINKLILKDVRTVRKADYNYCDTWFAITNDSCLWAWGCNKDGKVGDNTGIDKEEPVKILDNVKDIFMYALFGAYESNVWAITYDGSLYGWGKNDLPSLGIGDNKTKYQPTKLPVQNAIFLFHPTGNKTATCITPDGAYALEQEGNGLVFKLQDKPDEITFDFDASSGLGYNRGLDNINLYDFNSNKRSGLTFNGTLIHYNKVIASDVAYAYYPDNDNDFPKSYISKSGDLYCWGGVIGDGTNIPKDEPTLVLHNIIQTYTTGGRDFTRYALSSDGTLYATERETFKWVSIASNVHFLAIGPWKDRHAPTHTYSNNIYYYSNDGSIYEINETGKKRLIYSDVALPKPNYHILQTKLSKK
jgi:hypothetical protein